MSDVATHGSKFESMLDLPEGTRIVAKSNDLDTGSLKLVLYNPNWEEVPEGENLEIVLINIKEQEAPVKLAYPH